jgi:competence ComEA-like helix-hairpin-helix protein
MTIRERLITVFDKARKLGEQLYTPRELRAIGLFLLLGICVLLYRHGRKLYEASMAPPPTGQDAIDAHRRDSLFFALSAAANTRDSLFFSLPEDSLLPPSVRQREQHHSKADDLRLGSISLNTSSKEELCKLPTVGPMSAERILEYRSRRGRFRSLDELMNVRGFAETRFEKLKRFLRLD